uniref:Usher syndrome 1C binding protein 1 n=1 Tax=Xiphophorus couchianus TaxID=32473 RepID=A0A3B5LQV1_9TELE
EVAQCEAEVSTLLSIIADLNKKMGSLKAPGGGVVWTQLQEVLSSVEDSISFRRTWAAPITASDQNKDTEHLRAAQENWTKATQQMLEEMERDFGISRCIERLKARNERLTVALERRKADSEQISLKLCRLESDCSALQMALRYEECEEAYGELLFLYEAKLQLKRERSAICPAKPGPGAEVRLSSETGQPVGTRWGHMMKDNTKPPESKREKASLFHELISVREEMSDLRALIRLKEKELRCLEWGLMGQKSQEAAGVFIPENLRDEAEDRKTEQFQTFGENATKAVSDGETTSSLTRPILKELQAVLQREQALKRRLAMVHDSLNSALADGAPHRKDNAEQIARLTQAHSKALSSYRQIRRKYREQVWRLEQKVAAMMESQHSQSEAAKAAEEGAEWRKEETIL